MKRFLKSLNYAIDGVKEALKTEKNLKIHLFIAFIVVIMSIVLKLSKIEFALILICIALVIAFEMINTAIEDLVDLHFDSFDKRAKRIKDVSAGAVLIMAMFSAIIGIIVFYTKLDILFIWC